MVLSCSWLFYLSFEYNVIFDVIVFDFLNNKHILYTRSRCKGDNRLDAIKTKVDILSTNFTSACSEIFSLITYSL